MRTILRVSTLALTLTGLGLAGSQALPKRVPQSEHMQARLYQEVSEGRDRLEDLQAWRKLPNGS